LAWADLRKVRTGEWPLATSGRVHGGGGVSWLALDQALRVGRGGLPGGSSLGRLLAQERGVVYFPPLTEDMILGWADLHRARTGRWPACDGGRISDSPGDTWASVNAALVHGNRGLQGGSSLALLLIKRRGHVSTRYRPRLSFRQILAWADAFRRRTGQWPTIDSGPVAEAPGENWHALHYAVKCGMRGLPSGWSLIRLFAEKRGVHSTAHRPPMTIPQILGWADAHRARHGRWPIATSGLIYDAPHETWHGVNGALYAGNRGLPGGTTLARLLKDERGVSHHKDRVPFHVEGILAWADAHHARTGMWPSLRSGPILESPGDTWKKVDCALTKGRRGLNGVSSVAQLLAEKRGSRHLFKPPSLTVSQILAWADAFQRQSGRWPNSRSGPISEAPGETWCTVNSALCKGKRGLPGGLSLHHVLSQERQPPSIQSQTARSRASST
jgi:hypothetical protein